LPSIFAKQHQLIIIQHFKTNLIMENSKKIQLGLLVVVAGLLIANMTGAFSGMFGGKGGEETRETIGTTADVTGANTVTPTDAGTPVEGEVTVPTGPLTSMQFEELEFDFGTVKAGEKVGHKYKFKNTGKEPLIISNAKGSCGCTVPSWPKEPIPVGGTGEIEVQFDSKGKKDAQSKRVTITANTDPAQTFLTIKGNVTPDPADEAAAAAKAAATPAAQ
jgi:Protein of unknown function (DUF1573)